MKHLLFSAASIMILLSCAAANQVGTNDRGKDLHAAMGKTWQWQETITPVEKMIVVNPERYTLLLSANGRAQIKFDCNRGGGDYKFAEGQLSFGPIISTRMACPEDSQDALFMKQLQEVSSFFIEKGELFLELPLDSGTMHFRQQP